MATLVRSEMGHVKQRKITRKPNTTQRWQNDELEKDSEGNARFLIETIQNDDNPTKGNQGAGRDSNKTPSVYTRSASDICRFTQPTV